MEKKIPQTPIIDIENLDFSYHPSETVLENVCLKVYPGEFASIVGPNGGGKTTLVRLILGLLTPNRGSVTLFGGSPKQKRLEVGYTPQQISVDHLFPISVLDIVLTGRMGISKQPSSVLKDSDSNSSSIDSFQGRGKEEKSWRSLLKRSLFRYQESDYAAARRALSRMGLNGLEKMKFGDLSGGERQRVLIARSVCSEPKLLILDEPTNNMDPVGTEILYHLLEELNQSIAILIVSHDLGVVSRYVQSVICVNRKVVVHPTSMLNGKAIREIYGSDQKLIRHDHRCSEEGHHFQQD